MQVDVINPIKTAMIVVDMQNDFVATGAPMETPAARRIVPKIDEALNFCRDVGIKIIYTAHVHRRDGCDMGLFDDLHPPIANRDALVDGTPGVEIYPLQRLLRHRFGYYSSGVGHRYGHHIGHNYRLDRWKQLTRVPSQRVRSESEIRKRPDAHPSGKATGFGSVL